MKKIPAAVVVGLGIMVLTVILYFAFLGNVVLAGIHIISLFGILIAEGITTLFAMFANGSPRKIAAVVLSALLVPFAATLSLVYIVNFPLGYGAYVGWYCAATLVVVCLAWILFRFDTRKSQEDHSLQHAKNNMTELRKMVLCILADPDAKPYTVALKEVDEKLRFSGDNVISTEDDSIRQMLQDLQKNIANPDFDKEALLRELKKSIDRRAITTKRSV